MFFPISDSPNPKGISWATWTIIALNGVAFLVINLQLGASPETTAEINRYLAAIERQQRLHVGQFPQPAR